MADEDEIPARPKVANPPATRKGRRSAAAFKEAAAKVFAERGFLNATVSDIAAEAGRSPAAFYYHYDSKDHILLELFNDFSDTVQSRARDNVDVDAPPREQIERLVRNFYETYVEWLPVLTGVFQLSMIDTEFHERWRTIRLSAVRAMRHWVTAAQASGHASSLDPDFAASALAAMLDGFCYIWLARGGDLPRVKLDAEKAQRTLADLCFVSLYGASEVSPAEHTEKSTKRKASTAGAGRNAGGARARPAKGPSRGAG
jgi:AcrR family transcriptional regulator